MVMELNGKLADRTRWSIGDQCSAARTLDLLSTKNVFMVVRECFFGTARFEDFVERIDASAPAISRTLKQLETAQIVVRVPYQEPGKRVRDEYRLTEKGEDLLPVLLALVQWGDKHLQNGCPPVSFVDARTGRQVHVRVSADRSEPSVQSDDVAVRLRRGRALRQG